MASGFTIVMSTFTASTMLMQVNSANFYTGSFAARIHSGLLESTM